MPAEIGLIVLAAIAGFGVGTVADPFVDSMYSDPLLYSPFGRCARCNRHLLPFGAVAIAGFVRWRGRCPHCGSPFPARALFLPLAMGTFFALTVVAYDDGGRIALTLVFGAAAMLFVATDTERRIIPNRLVYPVLALAVAVAPLWPQHDWWNPYATGAGFLLAAAAARMRFGVAVGAGDLKIAVLLGLTVGWPDAVVAFAVSAIAALGALMIVFTQVDYPARLLPYASMLAVGLIAALLWAEPLISSI